MLPWEDAAPIRARIDLRGQPPPVAEFLRVHSVLAEEARLSILALAEPQPLRGAGRRQHWHEDETRPEDLHRRREQPLRHHEPLARPGGLVQERLKLIGINLVEPAPTGADGEAVAGLVADMVASGWKAKLSWKTVASSKSDYGLLRGRPLGFGGSLLAAVALWVLRAKDFGLICLPDLPVTVIGPPAAFAR